MILFQYHEEIVRGLSITECIKKNMFNTQKPYEYLVKVVEIILNLNHNVQQYVGLSEIHGEHKKKYFQNQSLVASVIVYHCS